LDYSEIVEVNIREAIRRMEESDSEDERRYWRLIVEALRRDLQSYLEEKMWRRRRMSILDMIDDFFKEGWV